MYSIDRESVGSWNLVNSSRGGALVQMGRRRRRAMSVSSGCYLGMRPPKRVAIGWPSRAYGPNKGRRLRGGNLVVLFGRPRTYCGGRLRATRAKPGWHPSFGRAAWAPGGSPPAARTHLSPDRHRFGGAGALGCVPLAGGRAQGPRRVEASPSHRPLGPNLVGRTRFVDLATAKHRWELGGGVHGWVGPRTCTIRALVGSSNEKTFNPSPPPRDLGQKCLQGAQQTKRRRSRAARQGAPLVSPPRRGAEPPRAEGGIGGAPGRGRGARPGGRRRSAAAGRRGRPGAQRARVRAIAFCVVCLCVCVSFAMRLATLSCSVSGAVCLREELRVLRIRRLQTWLRHRARYSHVLAANFGDSKDDAERGISRLPLGRVGPCSPPWAAQVEDDVRIFPRCWIPRGRPRLCWRA